ncbi:MAG TPA: hypothetical protein VF945_02425, partial [Polyangia bacterium]
MDMSDELEELPHPTKQVIAMKAASGRMISSVARFGAHLRTSIAAIKAQNRRDELFEGAARDRALTVMRRAFIGVVCALLCGCGSAGIHHGGSGGSGGGSGGGGSGGNSGGPTFGSMCNGAATTITGVITAPNGHDPVANAFAYVAGTTNPFP